MRRPSRGGLTAAGVLVTALLAGAAGGAVAFSAAQGEKTPAAAGPVVLHQVAGDSTAAPGPTPPPASPSSVPAIVAGPAGEPAPAAVTVEGEAAASAADRAVREADRAEEAADRAEQAAPKPAPKATPVVHNCAAGLTWDEHGDNGKPGCVGLDCPTHQELKRTADGRPFCAYPEPTEGAKCGPGYGYGPGAFSDGKGGMVECKGGTWVKYVAPPKPTPTPVPTPQNCTFAEDSKCENWTPDGGPVVIG